jgi:thioesterase domain-containing protein
LTTRAFLTELRRRGVLVWIEGDRLRCNAPQGVLTTELRAQLAERKPEILAFLRAARLWSGRGSSLVPIQPLGSRRRFFAVPGHNGDVYCFVRLARHLGPDQPFYALEHPGLDGRQPPLTRIEDLAAYFVGDLRAFQPEGPYLIGGYCLGGMVAFEMARQLQAQGQEVALLALFEATCPTAYRHPHRALTLIRRQARRMARHAKAVAELDSRSRLRYVLEKSRLLLNWIRRRDEPGQATGTKALVSEATVAATRRYRPGAYPGALCIFLASKESLRLEDDRLWDWCRFATGGSSVYVGPDDCTSDTMLLEPGVKAVADALRERMDEAGWAERASAGAPARSKERA